MGPEPLMGPALEAVVIAAGSAAVVGVVGALAAAALPDVRCRPRRWQRRWSSWRR